MINTLNAHNFLTKKGDILVGEFSYEIKTRNFNFHPSGKTTKKLKQPYFVEGAPVEVHIHGVDTIDFSEDIKNLDLITIQKILRQEGMLAIPTVFLNKSSIDDFVALMQRFAKLKNGGKLENIIGFAVEGPILLSGGGTPTPGGWEPTQEEWKKLADCAKHGLKYVVISPDWDLDKLLPVAELLLSNGVYLSLGHSRKDHIEEAVKGIHSIVELASKLGYKKYSGAISVDHIFNDMPHTIKKAWRSVPERRGRQQELMDMQIDQWNIDSIQKHVGSVPGTLMQLAREGLVTLFLNFDGYHVDLQICKKIYELVGAKGIIPMTDRIETDVFGGQKLEKKEIGTLWYQRNGIVAAGSSTLDEQMMHMRSLNIPEKDIWQMCSLNPLRVFKDVENTKIEKKHLSFVDKQNLRMELAI